MTAVLTVLGTVGVRWDKEKKEYVLKNEKAFYKSNVIKLTKNKYTNTLPLLIDAFNDKDYKIIPICTKDAMQIQQKVLKEAENKEEYLNIFDNAILIEDENNFNEVFATIDEILNDNRYKKIIVDVTHGFRHLPLLMIIDLIMINFDNVSRVEKILFAKEIEKNKEYEIIDLKEYLDLANLNYVLSSFNRNYTTTKIRTTKEEYNEFLRELNKFSSHILANSLDALTRSSKKRISIIDNLLGKINNIKENSDDLLKYFLKNLEKIEKHLFYMKKISEEKSDYKKLYFFSKNMYEKGYLLNSITLLSEAIGMYAKEELKKINKEVLDFIEVYEKKAKMNKETSKKYNLYTLANQSKNIYKLKYDFKGNYLYLKYDEEWNAIGDKVTKIIKNKLIQNKNIVDLIKKIDDLRNNLAHGNSSKRLNEVEDDIRKVLNNFDNFIIKGSR